MIFTWDAQFLLLAYMRILDFESPILSKTKYQSSVILFYFILFTIIVKSIKPRYMSSRIFLKIIIFISL